MGGGKLVVIVGGGFVDGGMLVVLGGMLVVDGGIEVLCGGVVVIGVVGVVGVGLGVRQCGFCGCLAHHGEPGVGCAAVCCVPKTPIANITNIARSTTSNAPRALRMRYSILAWLGWFGGGMLCLHSPPSGLCYGFFVVEHRHW